MKRMLTSAFLTAALLTGMAVPAVAGRPTPIEFSETFEDADPCTGQLQTVDVDVVFWVHEHGDRVVARGDRTLATTGGYTGGGTSSYVFNGRTEVFRLTDLLDHENGNRLRAQAVFVVDLDAGTVRADKFELSCVTT